LAAFKSAIILGSFQKPGVRVKDLQGRLSVVSVDLESNINAVASVENRSKARNISEDLIPGCLVGGLPGTSEEVSALEFQVAIWGCEVEGSSGCALWNNAAAVSESVADRAVLEDVDILETGSGSVESELLSGAVESRGVVLDYFSQLGC
jgi:hypothetical protein